MIVIKPDIGAFLTVLDTKMVLKIVYIYLFNETIPLNLH